MKAITVRVWADSVLYVKDEIYNNDAMLGDFLDDYVSDCDMDYCEIIKVREHIYGN